MARAGARASSGSTVSAVGYRRRFFLSSSSSFFEVDDELFLLEDVLLELFVVVDFLRSDFRDEEVVARRLFVLDVERSERDGAVCARGLVVEDRVELVDGTTRRLDVRLSVVARARRAADVAPYSGNLASSCRLGANRDFVRPYSSRCSGA